MGGGGGLGGCERKSEVFVKIHKEMGGRGSGVRSGGGGRVRGYGLGGGAVFEIAMSNFNIFKGQ